VELFSLFFPFSFFLFLKLTFELLPFRSVPENRTARRKLAANDMTSSLWHFERIWGKSQDIPFSL